MSEDKPHVIVHTYVEWELSDTPGYWPVVWLSAEEIKKLYPK